MGKVSARWPEREAAVQTRLAEVDRRLEHQATDERMLQRLRAALERFSDTWERLDGLSPRELRSGLVGKLSIQREGDDVVCCVKLPILPATEFRMTGGP